MTLKFSIPGNQESPEGNPIPYFRQSQGSKWSVGARRYHSWQSYVQGCFFSALTVSKIKELNKLIGKTPLATKPIPPLPHKQHCNIFIHWASQKHGDPDNLIKGLLDSLWQNDKNVAVRADYDDKDISPPGYVEVEIIL